MRRSPGCVACVWTTRGGARFYELRTNRPIFSGRDGVIRYNLDEIEQERRDGYAWLGAWPRALVDEEYPAWKKRRPRADQNAIITPTAGTRGSSVSVTLTASKVRSRIDGS